MAAVKRIYAPGCKYDEMLVLESGQGLSKSTALQALCPRAQWFSDDLLLTAGSKQIIEATLGKWIIESSDLAGKRKTELEQLKACLSRQVDGARMAYARKSNERPRHFIIIGTTNSPAYLPDSTGARRFWPVTIKEFDVERLTRDRDQLWAEAVVRVKQGASIRLPKELWPAAGEQQEKRREVDPWEDVLHRAMSQVPTKSDSRRRISSSALWMSLGVAVDRQDRAGALRIGQIMQRLGCKSTTVRDSDTGTVVTGYVSTDEFVSMTDDESGGST